MDDQKRKPYRILIVEDETVIAGDIKARLEYMGYEVAGIAPSGERAVALAEAVLPDLVLMDIVLQGPMDGIEAAGLIRLARDIPVIYLTAYADHDLLERAKVTEPFGYIIKPFEDAELRSSIEMALYKHRMQLEIKGRNDFINTILMSLSHPFYVINSDTYEIELANPAANLGDLKARPRCHKVTHHSDTPCAGLHHPCTIEEIRRTGGSVVLEHVHFDKDCRERQVEVHGHPVFDEGGRLVRVIEYTIDITERKRLERQLQESQKLESVGRLAGGVAHDFSNIMSAVLGYSEMALMELPENHPVAEKLLIIRSAGEKAAALTRQLLAFSSRQVLEIKPVDLRAIVEDMARMLGRMIGEDISLKVSAAPKVRSVMADKSQIEQVLMNLAVNARDAMPEGGTLEISLYETELNRDAMKPHPGREPGPYVALAVRDTGHGIDSDLQEKIFEPFFTTKKEGKGTGLGLATVYGIVKQHKGFIKVDTARGKGTTFTTFFPAASAEGLPAAEGASLMPRGSETVLVVDDEPGILRLLTDTLLSLGYTVLSAPSAAEALRVVQRTPGIDLVITDVVMPGMNGVDLVKGVRAARPGIAALFISGYSDQFFGQSSRIEPEDLIQKPIRPSALAVSVRARLDRRESHAG